MITRGLFNKKKHPNALRRHSLGDDLSDLANKEKALFEQRYAPSESLPETEEKTQESDSSFIKKLRESIPTEGAEKEKAQAFVQKLRDSIPKEGKINTKEDYITRKLQDITNKQNKTYRAKNTHIKENSDEDSLDLTDKIQSLPKIKPKYVIIVAAFAAVFMLLLLNMFSANQTPFEDIATKGYQSINQENDAVAQEILQINANEDIQLLLSQALQYENMGDFTSSLKTRLKGVNSYIQMGEYILARDEAHIVSAILTEEFPQDSRPLITKLRIYHYNFLSEIYHRLNQPGKALTYGDIALEKSLAFYGKYHLKTIEQYQLSAFNLDNIGDFDKALEMRHQAINISLDLEDHLIDQGQLVTAMNNLGADYRALGHLERSITVLQQAIDYIEKQYGIDAPELVIVLNNLGLTHNENGHKTIALSLFQQAFNLSKRHHGRNHDLTAKVAKNITRLRGFR